MKADMTQWAVKNYTWNAAANKSPSMWKSDYTQVFLQENQEQVQDSEPSPLKLVAKLPPAPLGARVSPQA